MKKYFKEYTEHLSAIILLFYILGFSYQFCYYQFFDIKIQYYITLTDVIFQSIGNVLISAIIFFFIEGVIALLSDFSFSVFSRWKKKGKYDTLSMEVRKRADRYLQYLLNTNRNYYSFTIFIIVFIIGTIIFEEKLYFLSIILPNFVYGTYKILPKIDRESDRFFKIVLMIMLFVVLLFSYCYWGFSEAYDVSKNYSSKIIKTDNVYTGDGSNKFVGETSLYLFILNTKTKVVTVINKSSVDQMTIEPNKYQLREIHDIEKNITNFMDKYIEKKNKK
ncbi:hypothetical protein [Chryseobacterium profundimaris]|uniref:Uncharacterized protein n=1 Tax=Chryseobacterium profundimaris TaxID=1387275 RepID=A0ABY1NGD3_9FLAO|nr:hypothetical protein [Chryseobacterium profundimaris]SMP09067.1 hypothetical protein SAMN06264346_10224 [Chryseobacterium profundimaris]